jgi:hypothetical protein
VQGAKVDYLHCVHCLCVPSCGQLQAALRDEPLGSNGKKQFFALFVRISCGKMAVRSRMKLFLLLKWRGGRVAGLLSRQRHQVGTGWQGGIAVGGGGSGLFAFPLDAYSSASQSRKLNILRTAFALESKEMQTGKA